MPIPLTRINITGDLFLHVFENGLREKLEVPTTRADYEQLAGRNPQNPSNRFGRWIFSYQTVGVNTPSGRMEDHNYFIAPEDSTMAWIRIQDLLSNPIFLKVPTSGIVSDRLTDTAIDLLRLGGYQI